MRSLRVILAATILLESGCLSVYRGVPKNAPVPPARASTLYYKLGEFPAMGLGDGRGALRDFFQKGTGFAQTIPIVQPPEHGLFCDVEVKWKAPTIPAVVFGYISLALLTATPAWSMHEGYIVEYRLYKDGKPLRTFSYDITRKGAIWIVFLPVIWINAFTMSEREAVALTARRFIEEAAPLF